MPKRPVLLLIFDGWGLRDNGPGNAIQQAHAENYQRLLKTYPWLPIEASGLPVGLPDGQIGNSEVGHMTMGAGRILYQELTRIDHEIETGGFFKNSVFLDAIRHAKDSGNTLHLMGLVSNGGVHSSLNHLLALIDLAKQQGLKNLRIHAFLDGRDVPPRSAEPFLQAVENKLLDCDFPQIATVSGRYYPMDRDNRWERVEKAYDNLVSATGMRHPLSLNALAWSYRNDQNDEFVDPAVTDLSYDGINDGDSILFFNFRPDRARQITRALTQKNFDGFERKKVVSDLYFGCMCLYDETFNLPIAYPKQKLERLLAEVVSERGLKQFRTAETEKYAHVTFFFNGGFETPYPGEDRKLVPSPKVATYDLQPEMSLTGVTTELLNAINSGTYDLLVANFANPDMVGHTGKLDAAIAAVKSVDHALGEVVNTILEKDGVLLLTADHGNIETMVDETGGEHTAHTTLPVPFVLVSNDTALKLKAPGEETFGLANIAPTILDLMEIPVPVEMTSPSLLVREKVSSK